MKKKDSFLKRYLELREEIEDKYEIKHPDPITVLVYYLRNYTEIIDPRAMKRLLDVPLDRILDRLCKMGFISLPEKKSLPKKTKLDSFVYERERVPVFEEKPEVEPTDEEKLMDFVIV